MKHVLLALLLVLALAPVVDAAPAGALVSGSAAASSTDTGLGGTYVTSSVTLTANRLELLSIGLSACCTGDPAVTSTGATWVLHCQVGRRLFVYRTMVSSNQTGAVTITMPGGEGATNGGWSIVEWTGVDTGGTNGSAAAGQCDPAEQVASSLTVNMSGFSSASNRPYVTWKASASGTQTVESGWTSLADTNDGTDGQHYSTWWRDDTTDTTPFYSFSSSQQIRGLAIDVKAPVTVGSCSPGFHVCGGGLIQ